MNNRLKLTPWAAEPGLQMGSESATLVVSRVSGAEQKKETRIDVKRPLVPSRVTLPRAFW